MKLKTKIYAWLAVLLTLGAIAAYVFEFQIIENTFGGGELVWKSAAFGFLTGLALRWALRKHGGDFVSSARLWLACLLLPVLFAPLFGSLTNRLLSPHATQPEQFEFWEEKAYAADRFGFLEGEQIEPDGYYIFVLKEGKIKRLDSKTRRFEGVQKGSMVALPVKKGLWGFEVVEFD